MRKRLRSAWAWRVLTAGIVCVLIGFAAHSDLAALHPDLVSVAADLVVGVSFVVAGPILRDAALSRFLFGAVGVAWLGATIEPALGGLHQALLLCALVSTGLPARRFRLPGLAFAAVTGLPVAAGLVTEPVVGLGFLSVGVLLGASGRPLRRRSQASLVAAALVGACLIARWWLSRAYPDWTDPRTTLLVYEVVLILTAVVVPAAERLGSGRATPLRERLLAEAGRGGIDGLTSVLAQTLGDPALRVVLPRADGRYDASHTFPVVNRERTMAVVTYRSAPLDDPVIGAAVAESVLLVLAHGDLLNEQERQLRTLESTRARLLAAADRQRVRAATSLRHDVEALERVRQEVAVIEGGDGLRLVLDELAMAGHAILGLVAGVPPAELGGGLIRGALEELASRSPVPVTVDVPEDGAADAAIETTAYFVCAEALTNSLKHAAPKRIRITIRRSQGTFVVTVSDDGRGGADHAGRGLRGLADRVETAGGQLRVQSTRGLGTTVSAVLPLS